MSTQDMSRSSKLDASDESDERYIARLNHELQVRRALAIENVVAALSLAACFCTCMLTCG